MVPRKPLFILAVAILAVGLATGVALALFGPFGNGIYDIFVASGGSDGLFTARTGDDHPITTATGHYQNILFGGAGGSPGTSYMTIRSYTSETDYLDTSSGPSSSFARVHLDPYASVSNFGDTGVRTEWNLPGGQTTPDELDIVQLVNVTGTTADNSVIGVTTTITNNGDVPVNLGVRYLWDWQIAGDDGPSFTTVDPNGSAILTEETFSPPDFTAYAIKDNDSQTSPLFIVYGSASGPSSISPVPTNPDVLKFVSWGDAVSQAFDYTTNPSHDVATSSGDDDSAVLYYWGPDSDHPLTLGPGASVTVSAALFAGQPNEPPPLLDTPTPGAATSTPTPEGTPQATPTLRHRRAAATPTFTPTVEATATVVVQPAAPAAATAAATPSGGAGPAISPPATGDGPSGGSTSRILPGLLGGLLAITVFGSAVYLRTSRRRS